MIRFERSFDYELIRKVMTHPQIYPHISDDASPPAAEYRPIESDAIWYVSATYITPSCEDHLGFWVFHPHNSICWEVHTVLLPIAWGATGQEAARKLPAWMWENTSCRRIITTIPTTNRLALHFAIKAGMKLYGVNEASYLKNGVLCDQFCLGISYPRVLTEIAADPDREDLCQQQQPSSLQ